MEIKKVEIAELSNTSIKKINQNLFLDEKIRSKIFIHVEKKKDEELDPKEDKECSNNKIPGGSFFIDIKYPYVTEIKLTIQSYCNRNGIYGYVFSKISNKVEGKTISCFFNYNRKKKTPASIITDLSNLMEKINEKIEQKNVKNIKNNNQKLAKIIDFNYYYENIKDRIFNEQTDENNGKKESNKESKRDIIEKKEKKESKNDKGKKEPNYEVIPNEIFVHIMEYRAFNHLKIKGFHICYISKKIGKDDSIGSGIGSHSLLGVEEYGYSNPNKKGRLKQDNIETLSEKTKDSSKHSFMNTFEVLKMKNELNAKDYLLLKAKREKEQVEREKMRMKEENEEEKKRMKEEIEILKKRIEEMKEKLKKENN